MNKKATYWSTIAHSRLAKIGKMWGEVWPTVHASQSCWIQRSKGSMVGLLKTQQI